MAYPKGGLCHGLAAVCMIFLVSQSTPQVMMPLVIATRQKAIGKQKREAAQGRRVSYAKIWIKEFQKIYPNCPYTANNLSVHYWYWTSKDQTKEQARGQEKEGAQGVVWRGEQLEELRRVGNKVEAMLSEGGSTMGYTKLLHSVWLKLHPDSKDSEESLAAVLTGTPPAPVPNTYSRTGRKRGAPMYSKYAPEGATVAVPVPKEVVAPSVQRWTPRHNGALRRVVVALREGGRYSRAGLLGAWRAEEGGAGASWLELGRRVEDLGISLPQDWHTREVRRAVKEQEQEVEVVQEKVQEQAKVQESGSGLNARGQMRWTQQAVSDLLACHKLGLEAKTGAPDR